MKKFIFLLSIICVSLSGCKQLTIKNSWSETSDTSQYLKNGSKIKIAKFFGKSTATFELQGSQEKHKCTDESVREADLIFECQYYSKSINSGVTISIYSPVTKINQCDQSAFNYCQKHTEDRCFCIKYDIDVTTQPGDEVGVGEN